MTQLYQNEYISKGLCILLQRHWHIYVHCRSTHNSKWNQPRCPFTNEWIIKMWCICTIEFYSVVKKNKNMNFAE